MESPKANAANIFLYVVEGGVTFIMHNIKSHIRTQLNGVPQNETTM